MNEIPQSYIEKFKITKLDVLSLLIWLSYLILYTFGISFTLTEIFSTSNVRTIYQPSLNYFYELFTMILEIPSVFLLSFRFISSVLLLLLLGYLSLKYILIKVYRTIFDTFENKYQSNTSRTINFNHKDKTSDLSTQKTNFIASTLLTRTQNPILIAIFSFFYGTFAYLFQRIQLWCLTISFLQIYYFNSAKSFIPLIVFTGIIAILKSVSEIKKLNNDKKINSRVYHLEGNRVCSRGEIRPGDIIELKNGDEAPCDMLITESVVRGSHVRCIFSANEAQVTGENSPQRKFVSLRKGEQLSQIYIESLFNHHLSLSLSGGQRREIDERNILFGNSILICDQGAVIKGVACWVSTETRALSKHSDSQNHEQIKQTSPYEEYSMKDFLVTLFLLLVTATIHTFLGIQHHQLKNSVNFYSVWINNIMYLNMMVPQALEQVRMVVETTFSYEYRNGVQVNDQLVADTLGYITRVVTDKTGSLTRNLMIPELTFMFIDNSVGSWKGEYEMFWKTKDKIYRDSDKYALDLYENAIAIFANAGEQPEEKAIQEKISEYATLEYYSPPDPDEFDPGEIVFKTVSDGKLHQIQILTNFGFHYRLISKSCLICIDGKYYIAVQAGGEDFWTEEYWKDKYKGKRVSFHHPQTASKLRQWNLEYKKLPNFPGSQRIWSHGLKKISADDAAIVLKKWAAAVDSKQPESVFEDIIMDQFVDIELKRITLILDTYRDGVIDGIEALVKRGKQISVCTGDSLKAAITIAKQFHFPENHIVLKAENVNSLAKSIEDLRYSGCPMTVFFDQRIMKLLLDQQKESQGFQHRCFKQLFSLLDETNSDGTMLLHYTVFCRATPSLKPFVVQLMQHKEHNGSWWNSMIFPKRNYVLAVGDGANDMNMFYQADVSFGVKSGETEDVVSRTSLWSFEWKHVVDLLLKEGPEKSSLVALMVKLVFLKHWMTAFTLLFDFYFRKFPLYPMDPIDPVLQLLYNCIIFTQLASHTAIDQPTPEVHVKKELMTLFSFFRWVLAAALTGFAIDASIRTIFPNITLVGLGSLILVAQAIAVSIYLILITNEWSRHHHHHNNNNNNNDVDQREDGGFGSGEEHHQLTQQKYEVLRPQGQKILKKFTLESRVPWSFFWIAVVISFEVLILTSNNNSVTWAVKTTSFIFSLLGSMFFVGKPAIETFAGNFFQILKFSWSFISETGVFMPRLLHWSHTWDGRILPIFFYIMLLKVLSGISMFYLFGAIGTAMLYSIVIFYLVVSKHGFLRRILLRGIF